MATACRTTNWVVSKRLKGMVLRWRCLRGKTVANVVILKYALYYVVAKEGTQFMPTPEKGSGFPLAKLGAGGTEARPSAGTETRRKEGRRARLVLAVLLITVALIVAGVVIYVATRPPPLADLTVMDGSMVGAIEGNLTAAGSNQTDLVLDFSATSYAEENGGAVSTLTLRLHTWTFFDSGAGSVRVNINATVVGEFALGLPPTFLQLSANQTGVDGELQSWAGLQSGTNVSFDPGYSFGLLNGTGVLSATILATRFTYSDYFAVYGRPWYNRFVGFRASVTGAFAPAVSVGILLKVINTDGGIWA